MIDELEIQAQIVKQMKVEGGYACKMNNKFLAGIPDLLMAHKDLGVAFVEVKIVKPGGLVLLTPLQKDTLGRMRNAGMNTGILAIDPASGPQKYICYATRNLEVTRIDNKEWISIGINRGNSWPSYVILGFFTRAM